MSAVANHLKNLDGFKAYYEANYGPYPGIPGETWDQINLRVWMAFAEYVDRKFAEIQSQVGENAHMVHENAVSPQGEQHQ